MDENNPSGVTHAAMYLIQHQQQPIDSVICLTETGATASLLSRFRPKVPVHALTSNEGTYRKLSLHFGVIPHIAEFPAGGVQEPEVIAKKAVEMKFINPGDDVLIIYGSIWKTPGLTNSFSLIKVPH
jgi:pyruvate kinase